MVNMLISLLLSNYLLYITTVYYGIANFIFNGIIIKNNAMHFLSCGHFSHVRLVYSNKTLNFLYTYSTVYIQYMALRGDPVEWPNFVPILG